MKHLIIIALLAAAPFSVRAQQASEEETRLLNEIAQCLAVGLPHDWRALPRTPRTCESPL